MRKIVWMMSVSLDGFWPPVDADPASNGPMAEFARIWRDMPKIVFSRTLEQAECNTPVLRAVDVEEMMELKAQPGGDLALGGSDLAAAFIRHDLIDEYRLYFHPVVIGRGKPAQSACTVPRLIVRTRRRQKRLKSVPYGN